MSGETVEVLVRGWAQTRPVPLRVNGVLVEIPIGKPTPIPATHLAALQESSVKFELVGQADDTPESEQAGDETGTDQPQGADGDSQGATNTGPETSADNGGGDLLSILDSSAREIEEKIKGLTPDDLKKLLDAEEGGKTRKSVIALLTKALEGK